MNLYYTNVGSVRGRCNHRHASIYEAHKCNEYDDKCCKEGNGNDSFS